MRLHWAGHEDELGEPMNADDAVDEFQEGMLASRNSGTCILGVVCAHAVQRRWLSFIEYTSVDGAPLLW